MHAVPTRSRLAAGDLLSIDFAAHLDGWCADAAVSFVVGAGRDTAADAELIGVTESALRAGIAAAQPGGRLGDVSHASAA